MAIRERQEDIEWQLNGGGESREISLDQYLDAHPDNIPDYICPFVQEIQSTRKALQDEITRDISDVRMPYTAWSKYILQMARRMLYNWITESNGEYIDRVANIDIKFYDVFGTKYGKLEFEVWKGKKAFSIICDKHKYKGEYTPNSKETRGVSFKGNSNNLKVYLYQCFKNPGFSEVKIAIGSDEEGLDYFGTSIRSSNVWIFD